jgi:hypothetical protein
MKKRALVVAPFYSGSISWSRPDRVAQALATLMPVDIITSDFDHSSKQRKTCSDGVGDGEIEYIPTIAYSRNIGITRFLSHVCFAVGAANYFRRNRDRWDAVYATVPINLAALLIFALASPDTLKIVDVVDIWPDVLPFSNRMRSWLAPFLWIWKLLFKGAIKRADVLLAVSDSFLYEAQQYNRAAIAKRFYLGHEELTSQREEEPIFTISYIGNIGHLYDFESLVEVCSQPRFRGRTQLFIIGDGDRREWLTSELSERGIPFTYFGTVYESEAVADILRRSHVGFNGYVNTTASFSYKAATYFAAGLPILNSMPGDLERLVRERKLGVNYTQGDTSSLATALGSAMQDKGSSMKSNVSAFFYAELEADIVKKAISTFLEAQLAEAPDSSASSVAVEQPIAGQLRDYE